jgi:hypothetical protein
VGMEVKRKMCYRGIRESVVMRLADKAAVLWNQYTVAGSCVNTPSSYFETREEFIYRLKFVCHMRKVYQNVRQ